jgi:hypothetical protein
MAAPIGNKFWMMRSTHGRNPIFTNPEALWNAACEYFEWVHDNPLFEEKVFHAQGVITKDTVCKMRAMTIQALCFFLDISDEAWADYCNRQDFVGITTRIKKVIYSQKLEGAAADLLNANIIARELGLSDKTQTDIKLTNAKELTNEQLAAIASSGCA